MTHTHNTQLTNAPDRGRPAGQGGTAEPGWTPVAQTRATCEERVRWTDAGYVSAGIVSSRGPERWASACRAVLVKIGTVGIFFRGSFGCSRIKQLLGKQAGILTNGKLDLLRHIGMLGKERLGVFAPLADTF